MPADKYYLDVNNHANTVTHLPGFYRKFYEDNQRPYVRQIPKQNYAGSPTKKIHNESKVFGLVCVHPTCNHGDVHRHHNSEVQMTTPFTLTKVRALVS